MVSPKLFRVFGVFRGSVVAAVPSLAVMTRIFHRVRVIPVSIQWELCSRLTLVYKQQASAAVQSKNMLKHELQRWAAKCAAAADFYNHEKHKRHEKKRR